MLINPPVCAHCRARGCHFLNHTPPSHHVTTVSNSCFPSHMLPLCRSCYDQPTNQSFGRISGLLSLSHLLTWLPVSPPPRIPSPPKRAPPPPCDRPGTPAGARAELIPAQATESDEDPTGGKDSGGPGGAQGEESILGWGRQLGNAALHLGPEGIGLGCAGVRALGQFGTVHSVARRHSY